MKISQKSSVSNDLNSIDYEYYINTKINSRFNQFDIMANVRTAIPIRSYTKFQMRIKLMNPSVDVDDPKALSKAIAMDKVKFGKLLKEKCSGLFPEAEWKRSHHLSEDVVKVILTT